MKRYRLKHQGAWPAKIEEHPQGKYCLYEDVPKWISIKEKLPEEEGRYAIIYRYKDKFSRIFIGDYYPRTDGEGYWSGMPPNDIVTHWMPLPEPPGEDDD